jgi:hypothetical protein
MIKNRQSCIEMSDFDFLVSDKKNSYPYLLVVAKRFKFKLSKFESGSSFLSRILHSFTISFRVLLTFNMLF